MKIKTKSVYSFVSADGTEHDNAYDYFLDEIESVKHENSFSAVMGNIPCTVCNTESLVTVFERMAKQIAPEFIQNWTEYMYYLVTISSPEDFLPVIAYCDPCESDRLQNLVNGSMNEYAATGTFRPQVLIVASDGYGTKDILNEDDIEQIITPLKQMIAETENALSACSAK